MRIAPPAVNHCSVAASSSCSLFICLAFYDGFVLLNSWSALVIGDVLLMES